MCLNSRFFNALVCFILLACVFVITGLS